MQDFESPPLQLFVNPWNAIKMVFNLHPSVQSRKISNLQDAPSAYQLSTPLLNRKTDLDILKSAFSFSKYAAGGRLTAEDEKEEIMKNALFNLRLD